MWLISLAILVWQRDLEYLTAVLRTVRDDALRRHRASRLGCARHAAVRGGAYFGYLNFSHVRARVGAWLDPFSNFDSTIR